MLFDQCHETSNLPTVKYNFVSLAELENLPKDSICGKHFAITAVRSLISVLDVISVVKEIGEVTEITTKSTQKQVESCLS